MQRSVQKQESQTVYADPFAYVNVLFTNSDGCGENLGNQLKNLDYFYEYRYGSEGYVAIKYKFVKKNSNVNASVDKVFANSNQKLIKVGEFFFSAKYMSLINFIKMLQDGDVVFMFNLGLKCEEVENLLKLKKSDFTTDDETLFNPVKVREEMYNCTKKRYMPNVEVNEKNFDKVVDQLISNYLPPKNLRFLGSRVLKTHDCTAVDVNIINSTNLFYNIRKQNSLKKKICKPTLTSYFAKNNHKLVLSRNL